jgi:poly-gamma-glutamate capsule biosynthesis protein CapA/YwtB (metallophosphatase superfamily)
MRMFGFLVRVGLVTAVCAGVFALLDDGAPDRATGATPRPAVKQRIAKHVSRPVPKGTFTFSAVGDVMMGSTPDLPPRGGELYFSGVQRSIRADVALANLEGTLSTGGSSKCGASSTSCFAFHTPPSYARWLRGAGFTILSVANNHAADFGPVGERQTLAALAHERLLHTGRPGEITVQMTRGIRVAVIGFAPYPWAQSLTDIGAAKRLVARARQRADAVIVTMHAGAEGVAHQHVRPGTETFLGENRGNPLAFAHAVVDAGADLVVGSGPHVLRGIEWYRGRLIVYSLGNFGGYGAFVLSGPLATTAILRVEMRGNGTVVAARRVAARVEEPGIPVLDPSRAAYSLVRSLSRADFGSAGATVSATGRIARA